MKFSLNQLNRKTGHRIKYAKVDADTFDEAEDLPDLGWLLRAVDLRAVDEGGLGGVGRRHQLFHQEKVIRGSLPKMANNARRIPEGTKRVLID